MTTYNFKDLTEQQFGRLKVTSQAKSKNGMTMWNCICSCGNTKIVRSGHLLAGRISSCGCYSTDSRTKHGMARTPEYKAWSAMKQRCINKKAVDYKNCGARGITVCDKWLNSFDQFLKDMGKKPHKALTLERRNNESGYSPDNCYWATRQSQVDNRRNTLKMTFNGETYPLKLWCKKLGVPYSTARYRIGKGMTIEQALGINC